MTMTSICRRVAFRAITNNDINALAKVVKNRIEANWRAKGAATGNTLLEYACELGHVEVARWLVDQGADINAYCTRVAKNVVVNDCGHVGAAVAYLGPLTTAIYFNQRAILEFLVRRGVNLDLPLNKYGTQIITCREYLATDPELNAVVEKVLFEMETPAVQGTARRRL